MVNLSAGRCKSLGWSTNPATWPEFSRRSLAFPSRIGEPQKRQYGTRLFRKAVNRTAYTGASCEQSLSAQLKQQLGAKPDRRSCSPTPEMLQCPPFTRD